MIGIWKCLVVAVCVFLSVDCRRIHENGLDKNAVRKTVKETQESIKDHGTIDLDNCTGKWCKIIVKQVVLVMR